MVDYVMVVGLIAAVIVSVTQIIVPGVGVVMVKLLQFMAVHLTTGP